MGGPGSGGHNKLSAAEHQRRGNFQPSRHRMPFVRGDETPVSEDERRRVLAGLTGESREIAAGILKTVDWWPARGRDYLISHLRIVALELADDPPTKLLLR